MTLLGPRALLVQPCRAPHGAESVEAWIASLEPHPEGWLLAHLDDGVVWGIVEGGTLRLRPGPDAARLRLATLQDLRVFSKEGEIRVWRAADGLRAAILGESPDGTAYDHHRNDAYLLLGKPEKKNGPFQERIGLAGHRHHPPAGFDRITVRTYYLADPESGLLRAARTRWIDLTPGGEE